jgi:hypothetical protein
VTQFLALLFPPLPSLYQGDGQTTTAAPSLVLMKEKRTVRNQRMAGSQFHNASDVCTAMKQFTTQTSQSSARGSFSTLDHLSSFSEALTCLCQEVIQLRAELDDLKTKMARDGATQTPQKAATPKAAKPAARRASARMPVKRPK